MNDIFLEKEKNIDIIDFINKCNNSNIDPYICMVKIIKNLSKTLNPEEIISIIMSFDNFNIITKEELADLISEHSKNVINETFKDNIINIFNIENQILNKKNSDHKTLPTPVFNDSGKLVCMPNIPIGTCLHEGCNKNFDKQTSLINHLIDNKCYSHRWHVRHEEYYYGFRQKEYIINNNKTNCAVCDFKGKTTQELLDHLTVLGISTYCDDKVTYLEAKNRLYKKDNNVQPITKIFTESECIICYDKTPQTLLYPCLHNAFCATCIVNKPKCPLCSAHISAKIIF